MQYVTKSKLALALVSSALLLGISQVAHAADDANDLKLAQKISETINTKGMNELCKEGGLLRGAATKDGSIVRALGTPGANCDRSETFSRIAIGACRDVLGDEEFRQSHCGKKAIRLLGGFDVPKVIKTLQEDIVTGSKVVKAVVCQTPRDKLSKRLQEVAKDCPTAAGSPAGAAKK